MSPVRCGDLQFGLLGKHLLTTVDLVSVWHESLEIINVWSEAKGVSSSRRERLCCPARVVALAIMIITALLAGCGQRILGRPAAGQEPSSWYIDVQRFNEGVHGSLDCSVCHAEITAEEHPDPDNLTEDATELFDYQICADCHPQEYQYYQQGIHAEYLSGWQALESEYSAPTCGHCHDPHYRQVLSRLQIIDAQVKICGQCHPRELESYLENYHGKTAVDLDYEKSASCADCHGSHRVLSLTQPQEAVKVCRKCHADATENMAGFIIHAEETTVLEPGAPRARDFVLLFFVQVFFILLTVSVLAFFYGHTLLWLLRGLHERLRRR